MREECSDERIKIDKNFLDKVYFSGIVSCMMQLNVGDYVVLDDGKVGYVEGPVTLYVLKVTTKYGQHYFTTDGFGITELYNILRKATPLDLFLAGVEDGIWNTK